MFVLFSLVLMCLSLSVCLVFVPWGLYFVCASCMCYVSCFQCLFCLSCVNVLFMCCSLSFVLIAGGHCLRLSLLLCFVVARVSCAYRQMCVFLLGLAIVTFFVFIFCAL